MNKDSVWLAIVAALIATLIAGPQKHFAYCVPEGSKATIMLPYNGKDGLRL